MRAEVGLVMVNNKSRGSMREENETDEVVVAALSPSTSSSITDPQLRQARSPGEAIEATVVRELQEELAIEVEVTEPLISLDHAYSHKKLRLVVHCCEWLSGEPQPLASQQVRWVHPTGLAAFPFPAANARIIAALLDHFSE